MAVAGANEDDIVVNYHSVCLYHSDLALFRPPKWLNDACLGFVLEWLHQEVFSGRDDLCFVHPGMVSVIQFEEDLDDLRKSLDFLRLAERRLVFFPVNDNESVTSVGGSHWSMLVFDRDGVLDAGARGEGPAPYFHHGDSYRASNLRLARRLAAKLQPILDKDLRVRKAEVGARPSDERSEGGGEGGEGGGGGGGGGEGGGVTCPSPTSGSAPVLARTWTVASGDWGSQTNGYDCGPFALCMAERIAAGVWDSTALRSTITPSFVALQRAEWGRVAESKRTPAGS